MNRSSIILILMLLMSSMSWAQSARLMSADGSRLESGSSRGNRNGVQDSTKNKEIPKGITVWTVDELSGDRHEAEPDTTSYLRMNHPFNEGIYGDYTTIGNNGTPRLNRIFIDRQDQDDFIFINGYSQFLVQNKDFHFTNTYSPITNFEYNQCGDKLTGEDHLKALFAVNINKQTGFGFKFDYLYSRGYYANQNTAHFNYTMWGSHLGDRYQAHIILSTNHEKEQENGGITDDDYIKHPEMFSDSYAESEIPTQLSSNWNRNNSQHLFFTHRYSFGFSRKVPMTEKEKEAKKFAMQSAKEKAIRDAQAKDRENGDDDEEENGGLKRRNSKMKDLEDAPSGRPKNAKIAGDEPGKALADATDTTRISVTSDAMRDSLLAVTPVKKDSDEFMKYEYVPVTSFFHTLSVDNYNRTYIAYDSPSGYYADDYYDLTTDSINDRTSHLHIRNNFGISLLEGFNKYMKAGLKVFGAHEFKHFSLPIAGGMFDRWNDNNIIVGGQLIKTEGKALHFNILGEFYAAGADIGQVKIDGNIDLNFPLLGDTVRLDANGFFHLENPSPYLLHYSSRHFQWNVADDFSKQTHTHVEGVLSLKRTDTRLRVAVDNLTNYTYLGTTYTFDDNKQQSTTVAPHQLSSAQVFTAQLLQNLHVGILHWDNIITYQKTSDDVVLPLPQLNIYSNLYLHFKIAKVLNTDFGVDARYFTEYNAPEYSPALQSYVVQMNDEVRTKVGNYPFCNVYANFQLKSCRFFVMMSHVNCSGKGNYFLTPHHPLNGRVLRFGLNWNFFN